MRQTALLLVGLGIAGLLVYATLFFDADAFVREHEARTIGDAMTGRVRVDKRERAKRARWHAGQAPCFAYAPPEVTAGEIDLVAADLASADAAGIAAANLSLLADWSVADERSRHGYPGLEELLAGYDDLGWFKRILLTLNRGRIVKATLERVYERERESRARAARREATLPAAQVARLRGVWRAHRLHLPVPALLALKRALDRRTPGAAAD